MKTVYWQATNTPKVKLFETVVAELLQVGRPSCHLTNGVKALKDDIKKPERKYYRGTMLNQVSDNEQFHVICSIKVDISTYLIRP